MKKRFITMVLAAGLFAAILCCSGCLMQTPPPENEIKFATFTQQERKDYINRFLETEYGFSGEVSDVRKKQTSPFQFEEYYFTLVRTPTNDVISVWVSDKGEITDTVFLLNMQDSIYDYFEPVITKIVPGCKVRTYTELLERPTSTLTEGDDIKDFLSTQDTFTFIRIFVDKNAEIDETILDELEPALNYCACSIYIYFCEDLENVDIHTHDPNSFTYSWQIEKKV